MHRHEFKEVVAFLEKFFPRLLSDEAWVERWFKTLGNFRLEDVLGAIDAYTEGSTQKPTAGQIKALAFEEISKRKKREQGFLGNQASEMSDPAKAALAKYRKTSRIEFCMDVLGAATVTEELQNLTGQGKNVNWAAFLSEKTWIENYNRKLDEMFEHAKNLDPEQYRRRFKDPRPMELRAEWL